MKTCTHCGTPMTSESPEGLCARCLLSVAMKDDPAATTVDSSATQDGSPGAGAVASAMIDIGNAAEVARRLPQFEILELLGRGGMGVVYKARQVQLDRIVALKILPRDVAQAQGFIERFRREARSLAKLSHPNIVGVYDFAETGGLYYFVMEFVDGLNLRQMILAHRLTPAEALAVVPKICDALQFAHEEGVVHRDIKPENILIDKKGRVKIADFGLAKLLRREQSDMTLTHTGATLGTPRYMAPEQMDKPETVDHRADIYSLGVVFYEMLTGELPMGRFAPPSQKVQIDVRLDEIVLHALERDVDRRYQHASEVKSDLETVTGKADENAVKDQSVSNVSSRTALFTDLIQTAAWTGIIWFAMFKLRSAWPLVLLFFWDWQTEIVNEDARRWLKLSAIMCMVGLCGYGMWISESFWPVIGLVCFCSTAALTKKDSASKTPVTKEPPESQASVPVDETKARTENVVRAQKSRIAVLMIMSCIVGIGGCLWPYSIVDHRFLGLVTHGERPPQPGVVIDPNAFGDMAEYTPASKAGIIKGDTILSMGGREVHIWGLDNPDRIWKETPVGANLEITVMRNDKKIVLHTNRSPDPVAVCFYANWQLFAGLCFLLFAVFALLGRPTPRFTWWRGIAATLLGLCLLLLLLIFGTGTFLNQPAKELWNVYSWAYDYSPSTYGQKLAACAAAFGLLLLGTFEIRRASDSPTPDAGQPAKGNV